MGRHGVVSTRKRSALLAGGVVALVAATLSIGVVRDSGSGGLALAGSPADVVSGRAEVDVWVPESTGTVGLARTRPGGAELLAVPTQSIASSPIVLGLPRDAVALLARRVPANRAPRLTDLLALARDPAGWGLLATGEKSWGPVRFCTPDPGTTTLGAGLVVAAVAGLTGVQRATWGPAASAGWTRPTTCSASPGR